MTKVETPSGASSREAAADETVSDQAFERKIVYPEVEKYNALRDEAVQTYARLETDKYRASGEEERAATAELTTSEERARVRHDVWGRYNAAIRAARREKAAKLSAARAELVEFLTANDKFAAWLLTDPDVQEYSGHAEEVLSALPMNYAELLAFGQRQGWCNMLNHFLRKAVADGVLTGPTPVESARAALPAYVQDQITSHRPYVDRISELADAVAKADVEADQAAALGRVGAAWDNVRSAVGPMIDLPEAERLFNLAVRYVVLGEEFPQS